MKKKILHGTSGDAILMTAIKMVTIVLGFAVTRLLSQYLSVYDYGTYSQILLIVSTVSSVTTLGMIDGMNYFYCSERDEQMRDAYVSTIFALQCIINTIAGAAVLLLSGPLCRYLDNPDLKKLMIFAVLLPFLQNLLNIFQVLLVAVGQARILAFRNLIVSMVRLAAVIIVVTVVRNVSVVLLTTIVLDIGQIVFFNGILEKNRCTIQLKRVKTQLFKRILQYCVPMGIFVSLRTINRDIDKYIIALLTDTETVAIYANASKVLPFDIITSSFYTILAPTLTRCVTSRDNPKAILLYRIFLEISYITTLMLCCAALAVSPQLMKLLYSNKYMSGLPIFCIYIFVDMLSFANITIILSAAGRTKILMKMSLGSLAVNVILNVLFYYWMGLIGPAVVTFLIALLTGTLLLYLSAKELGTKVSSFFDLKFLVSFLLENIVVTILMFQFQQWLDKLDIHYFVVLILVASIYCGLFAALHGKRVVRGFQTINEVAKE